MKLFLTSSALDDQSVAKAFLAFLDKKPEDCSVLMLSYTENPKEEFYVNESKSELENLGFKKIMLLNMGKDKNMSILNGADIIYVCGGNTYSILQKMREGGFDTYIKDHDHSGTVYFGVSAGSIIAGPHIEIAGYGSEGDPNTVGLKDLIGLRLTEAVIFPHYRDELEKQVSKFRTMTTYPVIPLRNGEALEIEDGAPSKAIHWKYVDSVIKPVILNLKAAKA